MLNRSRLLMTIAKSAKHSRSRRRYSAARNGIGRGSAMNGQENSLTSALTKKKADQRTKPAKFGTNVTGNVTGGIRLATNGATQGAANGTKKAVANEVADEPQMSDLKGEAENEAEEDPANMLPTKEEKRGMEMIAKGQKWINSQKTIFLSIDVECWERDNKKLTEFGVAVYDPEENRADSRYPEIRCTHLIVQEHVRMTNGRYVSDNKHNFSFGRSLVMPNQQCEKTLSSIIDHYVQLAEKRGPGHQVVYVGHGFGADLDFLKHGGYNVPQLPVMDTMVAWKACRGIRFAALSTILNFLRIPHGLLHNAGNDAYHTLQVMLRICDPQYRKLKGLDEVPVHVPSEFVQKRTRVEKSSVVCRNSKQALDLFFSYGR
uniref:ARAD1B04576p n=1 Tax=Blastobotrys adeninivorans TaxID=409370 RepID=A0A060T532_BLAAD